LNSVVVPRRWKKTRRQIKEIPTVRQALISREELEETEATYEKMKPSCARLLAGLEEDIKANCEKIDTDLANAKMKAIKQRMKRKEAESKAYREKMMVK
jgi:hypothetical protein